MENVIVKLIDSSYELDQCLKIREQVFIKEQKVPVNLEIDKYDDINNIDVKHFIIYYEKVPIGTLRLLNNEKYLKIGRVAILKEYRKNNLGFELLKEVQEIVKENNIFDIENKYFYLESQLHAVNFYEKLGFKAYGNEFLDANIKHRKMKKNV